ncbi:MAG: hypothetical protein R3A47_05845 [Polyangiales bacterium]
MLRKLLTLIFISASVVTLGCEDGGGDTVVCGEGTVLVDGLCVLDPDTTEDDQLGSNDGQVGFQCGAGTVEVDGFCVPESDMGSGGTAGDGGTAGTAGDGGTAGTAGDGGTAGTAGDGGTAGTAGDGGTAGTAGDGGTAGTAGDGGTAGTGGTPIAHKRVFVTRASYSGNLGGEAGAHDKCKVAAEAVGLEGNFRAWITGNWSDTSGDDDARRGLGDGPWYRTDDVLAFNNKASLGSIPNVPLNVDELGDSHDGEGWTVWTGTGTGGLPTDYRCGKVVYANYFSWEYEREQYGKLYGTAGEADSVEAWTDAVIMDCSVRRHSVLLRNQLSTYTENNVFVKCISEDNADELSSDWFVDLGHPNQRK